MSATIDEQFVEYIVKTLVGNPDEVKIERTIDEKGVLLKLYVAQEDLGRVIGRAGTTAKSIRTLLRALSVKNDARYNLKIMDTDQGAAPVASIPSKDSAILATDDGAQNDVVEEEMEIPDHSEESNPENDVVSRSRREVADLTDDLDL